MVSFFFFVVPFLVFIFFVIDFKFSVVIRIVDALKADAACQGVGATQDKYRLDGCSFYQSSIQAPLGPIDEYKSKVMANTVPKRIDARTSSMISLIGSRRFEHDDGSSVCEESRSEYSDVSSFIGTHLGKTSIGESDQRNRRELGESSVCCTMVGDFNTFFCLPISSFRSKPLPKPIIWKDYTCLQAAWIDACEANFVDISFCKSGSRGKTLVQTEPCHEVLSVDASTVIVQDDATNINNFFRVESWQEYIELAKMAARHFLKRRIFVDDSEINTSKDDVDDYDSAADSTIFATTE